MRLLDADVRTAEVLGWRGLHLFHFPMSSCSQKVRVLLALKGVEWTPHVVDLRASENNEARFLGINPRGLVPVLIADGEVHVESNDIAAWIEARHPVPALFPADRRREIEALLREEDALHLDLRTLSFRFVLGRTGSHKSPEALEAWRRGGSGTVGGRPDAEKAVQLEFYERIGREGITDEACRGAAARFRERFDRFDAALAGQPFLLGAEPSVVDIAWFVYAYRLDLAGWPFESLHPNVARWLEGLGARSDWRREVEPPAALAEAIVARREAERSSARTLRAVCGL